MDVKSIYFDLLQKYGHQGWWPLILQQKNNCNAVYGIDFEDLCKYETVERDPFFEIALGALLTQNTSWKNAEKALINLFEQKILTPQKILGTGQETLAELIRPSGYYRQKAKKIICFSEWLLKNFNGKVSNLCQIKDREIVRENLLDVWGIGKETADSIILYALNQPIFVVDAYSKRLCDFYGLKFPKYDDYRLFFEKEIEKFANNKEKVKIFAEYHALIVKWGKEKKSRSSKFL